ncbi:uncharacterized protein [Diadema antillarum]|uniref:uncharacterized protein n=1 Tax=Diadema antillarum TaxID=105358 RepID=UPI003A8435A8
MRSQSNSLADRAASSVKFFVVVCTYFAVFSLFVVGYQVAAVRERAEKGDSRRDRQDEADRREVPSRRGSPGQDETACAQNPPQQQVPPPQQFLPGWVPVNNIHVGSPAQTNCSALEELVAMATRQRELSKRILASLESIPRKPATTL